MNVQNPYSSLTKEQQQQAAAAAVAASDVTAAPQRLLAEARSMSVHYFHT